MHELSVTIENVRDSLQDLLEVGDDPLDPQIIHVSQELDNLLNRYYKLFSQRENLYFDIHYNYNKKYSEDKEPHTVL